MTKLHQSDSLNYKYISTILLTDQGQFELLLSFQPKNKKYHGIIHANIYGMQINFERLNSFQGRNYICNMSWAHITYSMYMFSWLTIVAFIPKVQVESYFSIESSSPTKIKSFWFPAGNKTC